MHQVCFNCLAWASDWQLLVHMDKVLLTFSCKTPQHLQMIGGKSA